jgi:hypothetical protein
MPGPKYSGQNAKPSKKCGWRKKTSNAGKNSSPAERASYWSAKQAGDRENKKTSRKERNKKRAMARRSAKDNFRMSRKSGSA